LLFVCFVLLSLCLCVCANHTIHQHHNPPTQTQTKKQIPTKIEVYIAPPSSAAAAADQQQQLGPDGAPAITAMRRLGYLTFDANERSGHQARELKSVHVSVDAAALRLVVHRCHVNKLNIYNQVGVVALNLIGEPLLLGAAPGPGALSGVPHHHHPRVEAGEVGYYNRCALACGWVTFF
jgi:centrosomal protein CEP104